MRWDVFCRVIDNHGDLGVCWRLACALARRGQAVRLWVDDARALAWLAPDGCPGVQVLPWRDPLADEAPGEVVVEAFGCDPPPAFVARMAAADTPPVWLNLEYLSAEPYVERSHGLRSPVMTGPGAGLTKWFFYPGFSDRTGGLLQADAPDTAALAATPADNTGWLAERGWATRQIGPSRERSVLVFGYDNPALPALLHRLATAPLLLRLMPGPMQARLLADAWPPTVRALALPYVSQPEFDRLLAASDFNLVRGEDSFVRAQVASGAPFLWQIYPQQDGVHADKLGAFVDAYLRGAPLSLAAPVRAAFRAFNGLGPWPDRLPGLTDDDPSWATWHRSWQAGLRGRVDLAEQLLAFASARRAPKPAAQG